MELLLAFMTVGCCGATLGAAIAVWWRLPIEMEPRKPFNLDTIRRYAAALHVDLPDDLLETIVIVSNGDQRLAGLLLSQAWGVELTKRTHVGADGSVTIRAASGKDVTIQGGAGERPHVEA